jgi:H+/Cl- antiporter ClcA
LRTGAAKSDRPLLITGAVLMAVGVLGAFVQYNVSLSQSDLRDIASTQVLTFAMLALAVAGAGLYVAAAIARLLRLWLLRQVLENRSHIDRITAALHTAEPERD